MAQRRRISHKKAQSVIIRPDYKPLNDYLTNEGIDQKLIQSTLHDKRFTFLPIVVNWITYQKKEKPSQYTHYMKPEVIERGKQFLKNYSPILTHAETQFGVSKEIIVALLGVETNYCQHTGKYPIINVYGSLSVMDQDCVIQGLKLDKEYLPRIKKRAAWGRSELAAFLKYCEAHQIKDPYTIKGSWAGAIGYPQFIPSSVARWGMDGNADGKIDLFTYEDTIFSIANYLKSAGFDKENDKTWIHAIYAYNHSNAYVERVIALAAALK